MSKNIVWHTPSVERHQRENLLKQRSCMLWFTGLSGSGKSTLAQSVSMRLYKMAHHAYVLDGDNVRHDLCCDLGFTLQDREENIRRIGEVGRLFIDAGVMTLSAFISPLRKDRQQARQLFNQGDFIEIYCQCDLEVCEQRDPKGLYKKARQGKISHFTGISSPYEAPEAAELVINTAENDLENDK